MKFHLVITEVPFEIPKNEEAVRNCVLPHIENIYRIIGSTDPVVSKPQIVTQKNKRFLIEVVAVNNYRMELPSLD